MSQNSGIHRVKWTSWALKKVGFMWILCYWDYTKWIQWWWWWKGFDIIEIIWSIKARLSWKVLTLLTYTYSHCDCWEQAKLFFSRTAETHKALLYRAKQTRLCVLWVSGVKRWYVLINVYEQLLCSRVAYTRELAFMGSTEGLIVNNCCMHVC